MECLAATVVCAPDADVAAMCSTAPVCCCLLHIAKRLNDCMDICHWQRQSAARVLDLKMWVMIGASMSCLQVIDVVDCTGSGDVDTSKVEKADAEGCITGAAGRKLMLNPAWSNPTGMSAQQKRGGRRSQRAHGPPMSTRVRRDTAVCTQPTCLVHCS